MEAQGEGLTYSWEVHTTKGSRYIAAVGTGSDTACLSVPIVASRDGYLYRVVITDANGLSVTSEPATLHVWTGPVITKQPEDATGIIGSNAEFSVEAEGVDLTYRWEVHTTTGSKYIDATGTGCDTACASIPVAARRDGFLYRVVITDSYGASVTSEPAVLHVWNGPVITAQPEDATGILG